MATPRVNHAVAVIDGKVYAVGGYTNGVISSVERYDPAAGAWEAVAPLAEGRDGLAVAVLDGKLYAVGGVNDDDDALSSVERYDPATNAWEAVAPMGTAVGSRCGGARRQAVCCRRAGRRLQQRRPQLGGAVRPGSGRVGGGGADGDGAKRFYRSLDVVGLGAGAAAGGYRSAPTST